MLWGLLGAAFGAASVLVMKRMLRHVLEGSSPFGAVLIAIQPLGHFGILIAAAFNSRETLLWAAGGDIAALFICTAVIYVMGRRKV